MQTRKLPLPATEPLVAHRPPPLQAHRDRRLSVGHESSAMATVSSTYRQQKDPARRSRGKSAQIQRTDSSAAAAGKTSPSRKPDPELVEAMLRQFDLSTDFGPCAGISRLQRWNRAERLGLNPPAEIKQCLEEYGDMGESLWHNRL